MFYLESLVQNDSFSFSSPDLNIVEVMDLAQSKETKHIRWVCTVDCYYGLIDGEPAYKITD
jgi:hypothetical protein